MTARRETGQLLPSLRRLYTPEPARASSGHALACNHDAKPGYSARLAQALPLSEKKTYPDVSDVSYVITTNYGRLLCAGSGKLLADLERMAARAGPHEDGVGWTADALGGRKV